MALKNKKVLITGADGFIGSHLVEALLAEGADVRALVFYNSLNSWGWIDYFPTEKKEKIQIIPGDIRDLGCIKSAMQGCEIVFHLAALIAIPFSYEAPELYVDTNIKGTLNVLLAAKDCSDSVSKVIITSTSEVYGTALSVPIDETHPLQAQSPYSATKIAADKLAESFYKSFNLPVIIARPFNTYGGRQSARAIIPTIITQLLSGIEEIKLGDLTPTRDFVFVEDTARGFIEIAKNNTALGQTYNIATGREYSMEFITKKLIEIINPNAKISLDKSRIRPAQSEVHRLLGNGSALKSLSGWQPEVSIEAGLQKTVDWFKSDSRYLTLYKPKIYTK